MLTLMVVVLGSAAATAQAAAGFEGGSRRIVFESVYREKGARLSLPGSESRSPGCRRQAWHLDKIYDRRRQDLGSVLDDP